MMLDLGELVLILALVAILLLALFFVACRHYEDGLVGCAALVGIAAGCFLVLRDALRSPEGLDVPAPAYCLLIVCTAVFMLRHAYRVIRFAWAERLKIRPPRDPEDTVRMRAVR